MDKFQKRKQDVLSKLDKSFIGKWDEKIVSLCDKINSLNNYYTTSSCSGRILLMIDQEKKDEGLFVFVSHGKISFEKLKDELEKALKRKDNVKFKVEPPIIHISCESLEDAEKIQEKSKLAGWKISGIIGMKNNFTVELNGTERLEFPIIQNNKILVDDDFLKIIVDEANKKLAKSWMRIENLKKVI